MHFANHCSLLAVLSAAIQVTVVHSSLSCEIEKNEMYQNQEFMDALINYSIDCYMATSMELSSKEQEQELWTTLHEADECDASIFEHACRNVVNGDFFQYSGKVTCIEWGSEDAVVVHDRTPVCLPLSCRRDVTQLTENSASDDSTSTSTRSPKFTQKPIALDDNNNYKLHCQFENLVVEDYGGDNAYSFTTRPSSSPPPAIIVLPPTMAPTMDIGMDAAPTNFFSTKAPTSNTARGTGGGDGSEDETGTGTGTGTAPVEDDYDDEDMPTTRTSEAPSKGLSFAVGLTATVVLLSLL